MKIYNLGNQINQATGAITKQAFKGDPYREAYDKINDSTNPDEYYRIMSSLNSLFIGTKGIISGNIKTAYSPKTSLEQAVRIVYDFLNTDLQIDSVRTLCDLGCGNGMATKAVALGLNVPFENVVGVDVRTSDFDLEKVELVKEDLSKYLQKTDKKFDMISLCRPNFDWDDILNVLLSGSKQLEDNGGIFTYGDNITMRKFKETCDDFSIKYKAKDYYFKNMKSLDNSGHNIEAIYIPKSELTKAFIK